MIVEQLDLLQKKLTEILNICKQTKEENARLKACGGNINEKLSERNKELEQSVIDLNSTIQRLKEEAAKNKPTSVKKVFAGL